jgi:nucleoside-diphosphate-sugar epimerase
VTGPDTDVIFSIGLMGPQGLGDMSKLSAAQLGDLVEGTPGFTSEIFFDGDNTQQVIWVDDLVDPITAAIQGRQKYLSLYFSPSAARDGSTPSFAATLNAARLKIYHCPID